MDTEIWELQDLGEAAQEREFSGAWIASQVGQYEAKVGGVALRFQQCAECSPSVYRLRKLRWRGASALDSR
jgi:hypothetical protein